MHSGEERGWRGVACVRDGGRQTGDGTEDNFTVSFVFGSAITVAAYCAPSCLLCAPHRTQCVSWWLLFYFIILYATHYCKKDNIKFTFFPSPLLLSIRSGSLFSCSPSGRLFYLENVPPLIAFRRPLDMANNAHISHSPVQFPSQFHYSMLHSICSELRSPVFLRTARSQFA